MIIILYIFYAHGQSLRHILAKITKWHFYSNSIEVVWSKIILKSHPGVKKCHFGIFSEWAGMAVPRFVSPQESLTGIEKFFLFWVPMNI